MQARLHRLVRLFVLLFVFYVQIKGNATNVSNHAQEIQHAICKISTEDIEASANATIIRQLKGVCTSKEMNSRLDQLEKVILREILAIKQVLGIETYTFPTISENNQISAKSLESPKYFNTSTFTENIKIIKTHNLQAKNHNQSSESAAKLANNNATNSPHIAYERDLEAAKYNTSIQVTELGKSFLYYWKIYDILDIFTQLEDTYVDSPTFYLTGHLLQIKLYPRHLGTRYVALSLASNGNFASRHRFAILNQKSEQADLTSQILGVNVPLFRISSKRILNGNFTNDGSLLVKATIALHA